MTHKPRTRRSRIFGEPAARPHDQGRVQRPSPRARRHLHGALRQPDSAGSQFFVCLDNASFLDGQYTAFGALSDGDDTLGAIGATPVGPSNSGENSKPKERVEVTSIRVA